MTCGFRAFRDFAGPKNEYIRHQSHAIYSGSPLFKDLRMRGSIRSIRSLNIPWAKKASRSLWSKATAYKPASSDESKSNTPLLSRELQSTMAHIYVALGVVMSFAALTLVYARKQKTNRLPLPPSPKSDFLIGHLRSLPSSDEHKGYQQWGKDLKSEPASLISSLTGC